LVYSYEIAKICTLLEQIDLTENVVTAYYAA